MQKSEKTAEPSMEEILASIRKIIAEEPPQAPEAPPAAPVARSEPLDTVMKDLAGPPGDDLSDMLDEPAQKDTPVEPAQVAVSAPSTTNLGADAAKSDVEVVKSPFTQPDETGESPLMARLRGLAGTTNGATSPTNGSSPASDSVPEMAQPFSKRADEPAKPTNGTPAEETDAANRSLQDAIQGARSDSSEALGRSITGSIFGKSAAAGVERVPISIAPENEDSADEAADNAIEEASPEPALAPASTGTEQPIKADALPVDDVFASLTNDPTVEEKSEAQPLPVLPHQEVAEEQPEPPEAVPVAPVAAEMASAGESAEPAAVAEAQVDTTATSPRADLEIALAALVEPVIKRWLADNVPAMVERIVEEKMKEK